jgi:Cys-tRNA(Pro)/Cys-tRNA(Cys) deacylase
MPPTNNVTRLLEAKKIKFTAFELPAEKLGALETAEFLKVPPEAVFKTIVVKREKGGKPVLAVISGPDKVDLKQVAQALGEKKMLLTSQNEAEAITGLLTGGISPLALVNKGFQVLIDIKAQQMGEIFVSGGQRGLNLRLAASDLAALTNARFAPISRPSEE